MSDQPSITALRFEHYHSPIGIGHSTPRLSWRYLSKTTTKSGWMQRAYDVEVTRNLHDKEGDVQVFHVASADSVLVPWPDLPLRSREQARVRVRAFEADAAHATTEWSESVLVEAALLETSDWKARPISSQHASSPNGPIRPIRFRKVFRLDAASDKLSHARVYATAWGVYEIYLNGTRLGPHMLAPGWTSYKHRLLYQVYAVPLELLRTDGKSNVLAVEIAEGWYAGRLGFRGGKRCIYGDRIAALVQFESSWLHNTDTVIVASDSSWLNKPSAIRTSEIYDGEVYDMRLEHGDWKNDAEVAGSDWQTSSEVHLPIDVLQAQEAPPVAVTEVVAPIDIFRTPSGKIVVDFGQNLVGVVRIHRISRPSGHSISFKHAEVLEKGELCLRTLRDAKCTDAVLFSDEELVGWAPKYTFHGFRYVEMSRWDDVTKGDITALVLHTDMQRTGHFKCSDARINQLHKNVVWGMRGNFLSIPTDCPQRDERLGWTGDIAVFSPTANFLFDTVSMLGSWLDDVRLEQLRDEKNYIPGVVVPNILRESWTTPQAIWHDAIVLVPWQLHCTFADEELLRRQYESMKGWLDVGITRGEDGLWDPTVWQLGDWLDPSAPPGQPSQARTNGTLVADAYLVHVTRLLVSIARLIRDEGGAKKYADEATRLLKTFQDKYITPLGLIMSETQTGISLAFEFDLYRNNSERAVAAQRLSRLVRSAGFRISTGFAGTPLITHALVRSGQPQLAYRMLHEERCPSWLYPLTMGATTMWERWDSMLPDGSINPGSMTSFNHFALGSVADFLHTTVGGIAPLEPGWRVVKVQPVPGGDITSANVSFDGPYGLVSGAWTLEGKAFKMSLTVPPNSKALVILSGQTEGECKTVGSGRHNFESEYQLDPWPTAIRDPFTTDPVDDKAKR